MTGDAAIAAAGWRVFMDMPAAYAEPGRLAACLEGTVSRAACARLLGTERLHPRLSALIARHYGLAAPLSPDTLDEADRAIALAPADRLAEIARRAGAIHWSASLAAAVLAREVEALHAELGEELCAFAIANRDLSGPRQPVEPLDGIADRIAVDGWRCLGAWCRAVPAAVGARVRLKLVAGALLDDAPDAPFAETGPALVRRARS